jgi:hypothetical protein
MVLEGGGVFDGADRGPKAHANTYLQEMALLTSKDADKGLANLMVREVNGS